MDPELLSFVLVNLFAFGGLASYTRTERRHRGRWQRFARRPGGPGHAVQVQGRAPKTIRRTALWSIYMGQMAVPGGALGALGLCVGGLGLVSIPGMILAIRIWRLGFALLRGDAKAAQEARALARFAVVLNVVAIVIGVALVAIGGIEAAPITAVLVGYGAVSFAHARAMRRCAELLEADRQARHAPTDASAAAAA